MNSSDPHFTGPMRFLWNQAELDAQSQLASHASSFFVSSMHQSLVSSSEVVNSSTSPSAQSEYPTLIILLAGAPVPSVAEKYGSYHDIFCQLFHNAFKSHSTTSNPSSGLRVISFDAVAEEYPTESDLNSAKGLLVTGSG